MIWASEKQKYFCKQGWTKPESDFAKNSPTGKSRTRTRESRRRCAFAGAPKSGSTGLLQAVEDLLGEIGVLAFDIPADAEYRGIRSELEAAGKPIGRNDLLIATLRD